MIADLRPYSAMKDSGVEWLGKVPEHWEVRRAKTLLRTVDRRSESGSEELLTVSSNHGVVPRRSANVTMFKAESYAGHKLCWPGDLVINSLWAWSRGLGVSKHHGIVSSAYGVYRARDTCVLDPRFLHELVRSPPFHWELRVRSKGVWTSRLQLTDESFFGAPVPLPPLPEQAAIVRLVDHADRRTRRYIRAKQKLIKLLEEQKQVIIHHAVTRGLDPNVRLKASGVEWLGDVPEHWEVSRLSQFFTLQRGFDITKEHQRPGSIPVVSSGGVASYHDSATAKGPGVLVGRKGTAGAVHYVESDFWAHDTTLWVNDFKGNIPRFVYFILKVLDLKRFDTGSANPTLNRNLIHPERLAFPPPTEQFSIASGIDAELSRLDGALLRAHREVGLLREYRTRLIADVVTGKLDVREAAARLPDEIDEPEPLDEANTGTDVDDAAADDLDAALEMAEA